MEGCIFHHKRWRGQTQGLLNSFRGKCLSAQHVKFFPKAVCICKETALPPIKTTAELTALGKWIKDVSLDTMLATAHPLLVSMFKEAESNTSPFRDSLIRARSIVKAASEGDYSALTPPPNPNETLPNPPPPSMTFELPITYTHLGVYFGTSGSNMKQLCKEHDVKVHLGPIKAGNDNQYSHMTGGRNRCSHLTGEKFEVTITGGGVRERNDFLAVQKEMLLRAQLVCGKREKHREHIDAWRKQRCNYSTALPRVNVSSAKEAAAEHFEKKKHHRKQKGSPEKKASILSDSRCLHCLGEYQPGRTEEGACSCHPGFLVPLASPTLEGYRTKWSCCQLLSMEQHPTHKAHAATGCSSARHLWRPGKTGKNGNKTIVKEPDFSVH
ncbi:uncharacterized protein LOC135344796 [Halichondria panicea]|uniref:uncharacterized protein LOC135344796 n=1 Tax=Halichondria panicea TaxID=6063 RepID=UPI00312B6ACD